MISPIFLFTCSALLLKRKLPEYINLAIKGEFSSARELATLSQKKYTDVLSIAYMDQAAGDMSMLLGDHEKAEKFYARSISGLAGSANLRAASCHCTGIQALYRNRFDIAAHCFRRNTEDNVLMEYKLGGFVALSFIYREAGLDKLINEIRLKLNDVEEKTLCPIIRSITDLVKLDITTYRLIYVSTSMRDHIFRNPNDVIEDEIYKPSTFRVMSTDSDVEKYLFVFLQSRKEHLMNICDLALGKPVDFSDFQVHLTSPFVARSRLSLKYTCLEVGLAAIAGRNITILRKLIDSYPWLEHFKFKRQNNDVRIDRLDHLFFLSKYKISIGSIDEGNIFYNHYVINSFQALDKITNRLNKIASRGLVELAVLKSREDDFPVARKPKTPIPVQCTQALDYIKENSFKSKLSVQEVANIVGVSVRWLQMMFKRHYGYSPKVLIRMEKISSM